MNPVLVFAEQRLWAAVALQLIDDYEAVLRKVNMIWFEKRAKVSHHHLMTLRQLQREAKGAWFQLVCEHINVHGSHVLRKFQQLEKQYKLSEVQFTANDEDQVSAKRKNLHIAR